MPRKRHEILLVALIVPTLAARSAAAQTPAQAEAHAPAARAVTLQEALAAIEAAPAARAAAARTGAAASAVAAAGGWPATTLGVATSHRAVRLDLTASLPLPIFGTLRASEGVARAELVVAKAEQGAVDLGARRDVTLAWVELARAEARADRSAKGAAREEELAALTQRRLDAGDAPRAEVVLARAAAQRARAQADADRAAIAAASAELAARLGWDPGAPLHAEGGVPALADVPPLERLRDARTGHPDARAAGARADAEGARVDEAHAARWPALSLDLESAIDDPTLPGNDFRVGLSLELPLLGRGGSGERAAAARRRAALVEREAALATIDGAIVAAYRRHQAASTRAAALEQQVLPAQREAAELVRTAYREGQGGLPAVLEADRTLAEAELEAIDARADAAAALADLFWAAGWAS